MVRALPRDRLHRDFLPAVLVYRRDRVVFGVASRAPVENVVAREDDEERVRSGFGDVSHGVDVDHPRRDRLALALLDERDCCRDHDHVRSGPSDRPRRGLAVSEVDRDTSRQLRAMGRHDDVAFSERCAKVRADETGCAQEQPPQIGSFAHLATYTPAWCSAPVARRSSAVLFHSFPYSYLSRARRSRCGETHRSLSWWTSPTS